MGLFDFLKKPKTDMEIYQEERKRREEREAMYEAQYSQYSSANASDQQDFYFVVEDVFTITGRGTVVTGKISAGSIYQNETVTLRRADNSTKEVRVTGIEQFRKMLDVAHAGENVGLMLSGVTRNDIGRGDILTRP
ncbi:MAG: hypothetical protein IJF07_02845 [Lachnospiraceae bacterium]|nr:hypothetical protein [Lachnospiraceae bacterium]